MYYRLNELDFIGAIHLFQAIFNNGPQILIGFKSGEFPGQSNTAIFIFLKQLLLSL